jgi:hypothetical protein
MSRLNRRLFLLAALAAASAFAKDKKLAQGRKKADELPVPFLVRRPGDTLLRQFGEMAATYLAATGDDPIALEIDYIGNESGTDKLPNDIGQFVRNELEKIGQFQSYRTLPEAIASPRSAGIVLPQLLRERPRPQQAAFRLVGSLQRATEVTTKGGSGRGDALVGGGKTQTNASLTGDRTHTITALTIALTLEYPNGMSVPGATAQYRIDVTQSEKNNSISVYIGGSGVGFGSKLKITEDSADALSDTVAIALIHVLGNALHIPYDRLSPVFQPDNALESRVRDGSARITQAQLEGYLKRLMIVDGFGLDRRRPELTDTDRALVLFEMRHRNIDARDRAATLDLVMQLWRGLNYQTAAPRVAALLAEDEHAKRERLERLARDQAALAVNPEEFGWSPAARIVVLDLSRIRDVGMQGKIEAVVRKCGGCGEVSHHPSKPLLGIRLSSRPAELQYALDTSSLRLESVWLPSPSPRLLVLSNAK